MFDHTKLIVGRWYPTRDGKRRRFLTRINDKNYPLVFALELKNGGEGVCLHSESGTLLHLSVNDADVISDEPIREKVEVKIEPRYGVVWERPNGSRYLGAKTFRNKSETQGYVDQVGHVRIGVAELPATILVEPV